MSRSFKITVAIILAGFLALVVIKYPRTLSRAEITHHNLMTAHSLGIACRAYRDDHEGRWPGTLDDLAPDYIEEDWVTERGFLRPVEKTRERWDYFAPDVRDPDPIEDLIRSPEPHGRYIVLIYTDGSGQYLKDRIFARREGGE